MLKMAFTVSVPKSFDLIQASWFLLFQYALASTQEVIPLAAREAKP